MKFKYCIKCGRKIPADYGFCKYCGAKQPLQTNQQSTPESAKAAQPNYNETVPKSMDNPTQTLKIAKSQANFARSKANNTATASRQTFSVKSNGANTNDTPNVTEASVKASVAESQASQMEAKVSQIASYSEAQQREAAALNKVSSASEAVAKKQRAINKKQVELEKNAAKGRKANHTHQVKMQKLQKKNPQHHAKVTLIWAYFIPIIVFFISVIFAGNSDTIMSILILLGGIISIVLGVMSKSFFKKASIIDIIWGALVALMGFFSFFG